jgi:hypothetical protein
MKILSLLLLFLGIFNSSLLAQNTVGTITNTTNSFDGYTLFTPTSDAIPNNTYLVNNCGEIVHLWASNFKGQGADLIMPDGSLFRASFDNQSTLIYAGNNGRLEKFDWEGNLLWGLTYSDTDFSFHHDYYPMLNGNILLIVAERRTFDQAVAQGRNPATMGEGELYTEKIIEIEPVGTDDYNIVWEWDLWDHIVQDFDASKANFGDVANTPNKLDFNFIGLSTNKADWVHFNALDYNESLDQIMISARFMSEVYIIDHSTTTAQAATSTGGDYGKGGDFLYRWGNPQAYKRGTSTDQILFGQHSTHWIKDPLPEAGKIMLFNNGFTRGFTTVEILETPDSGDGFYPDLIGADPHLPNAATIAYIDPINPTNFYAPFLSSAYMLENGNLLIDSGPTGYLFEVNPADQIVWEYVSPVLLDGTILSQEDAPGGINSRFFRARRYSPDYVGFDGRDLTASLPIEQNPIPENCELFLNTTDVVQAITTVYPSPANNLLYIDSPSSQVSSKIYSLTGQLIAQHNTKTINVAGLSNGIYIIQLTIEGRSQTLKFVKN